MVRLSIIVTVFNLQDYISECLDSLLDIGMPIEDVEIIVVDDGSNDESLAILSHYQTKLSHIKVYHQDNMGVGAARNLGIINATGKYLWFVDGDDLVIPDKVPEAISRAMNENADVLLFDYTAVNENGSPNKWVSFSSKFTTSTFLSGPDYYLLNYRHSYLWLHFFKREIFQNHNLSFHPSIKMQDGEIMPKILMHAEKVVYYKEKLIKYRFRPNSAVNNRDEKVRAHFFASIVAVKVSLGVLLNTVNQESIMYKALQLKLIQLNQMLFTNLINNDYSASTNKLFVDLLKRNNLMPIKKITGFTSKMNYKLNFIRMILNINPFFGRLVYKRIFS